MGTKGPWMTDFRNIKFDASEVVKGGIALVSLCGTLLTGAWWLSGQLTALQKQADATQKEVYKIEEHLNMPTGQYPRSYALPSDPDLSRALKPILPQTAIKE